jgi:2-dehydro-3-deoxyphosphogluconate aldolase/(4S)-4-hydroxy-2-oxoglutarate aldolase
MNDPSKSNASAFNAALQAVPVIPVIVLQDSSDAVPVAEALIEGGIPIFEITLRTEAGLPSIEKVARQFPDAQTGAGTVLNKAQAKQAIDAGSRYIVSPGWDDGVVETAEAAGIPVVPGVATATEVQRAYNHGLRLLKLFPAGIAGGIPMLKALSSVYSEASFVPTGGVSASNLAEFLALPNVKAVGGSWLTPKQAIADRNFGEITRLAQEARQVAKDVR